MAGTISIIDRGRGPQLSSSRVTVLDLFPYFALPDPVRAIQEAVPTLTPAEIRVVEEYIRKHRPEVEALDRRAREHARTLQNPAEVQAILRAARAERLAGRGRGADQSGERNGDSHPG